MPENKTGIAFSSAEWRIIRKALHDYCLTLERFDRASEAISTINVLIKITDGLEKLKA